MIDRESGTKDAAAVPGHSGVAVPERHYVERAAVAPEMSVVLVALRGLSARPDEGLSADLGG